MSKGEHTKKTPALCARLCDIVKWYDFDGYGFTLSEESDGHFIANVQHNSPARSAMLFVNDRIVEINDKNVEKKSKQEVLAEIMASGDEILLLVVGSTADGHFKRTGMTITSSMEKIMYRRTHRRLPKRNTCFFPRECCMTRWEGFDGYGFEIQPINDR
ncbi:Na(+)/H(+) exchange regulatory cofactor NHE-RF2-like [Mercenaria mercenaria]|uniref:Na(+)/H(+) exchange regulatory cofactor NHE-RF2-like n=1 Tax=Mercenaria mercenaria TaxID=6596 RepID=UPI00234EF2D8|nr:Na(+)/H(+) exchange regulatory cofactor NHE-RF2-like [Mercenaria mercenaria]